MTQPRPPVPKYPKVSRVSLGYQRQPEVSKEIFGTIHVDTTPLLVLANVTYALHEAHLRCNIKLWY